MEPAKRGRLSSIDLLPDEAWPHVRAALDALAERRRTQEDIRNELNNHLLTLGCDPVSRSAFHRKALQLAVVGEKIRAAREIAAVFAEKQAAMPEGDVALLINETIKVLIYELVTEEGMTDASTSAKMMKEVSLALYRLEQARKISHGTRAQIAKDVGGKAMAAIGAAEARGIIDKEAANKAREIMGFLVKDET